MSSFHMLRSLIPSPGSQLVSTHDNRSLFLNVLSWILDLDPKCVLAESTQAAISSQAPSTGIKIAISGYVSCLKLPGREALQLRTRAIQLLPGVLLGLTSAVQPPSSPGPLPPTVTLLSEVTEAVQWMADEYWSSDSKSLPR